MLKRAATVIWWCGFFILVAVVGIVLSAALSSDRPDPVEAVFGAMLVGGWTPLPAFCVAYVLGGSFWRPATGPLSKQEG